MLYRVQELKHIKTKDVSNSKNSFGLDMILWSLVFQRISRVHHCMRTVFTGRHVYHFSQPRGKKEIKLNKSPSV